jgi:hypothetical protein
MRDSRGAAQGGVVRNAEPDGAASFARCYRSGVRSTRIRSHIEAPREAVYRALLDPLAVSKWSVPND